MTTTDHRVTQEVQHGPLCSWRPYLSAECDCAPIQRPYCRHCGLWLELGVTVCPNDPHREHAR